MEQRLLEQLAQLILEFRGAKPVEPGELARRYAVTITDLERAFAFFATFVAVPLTQAGFDPIAEAARSAAKE